MRIVYAIILLCFYLIMFRYSWRKTKDLFSPLSIFALFSILRYVPNMISKKYEHFTTLNDSNLLKVFVFEILSGVAVALGISFYNHLKTTVRKHFEISYAKKEWQISYVLIAFLYLIGMFSRYIIIRSSGGINTILNNMGQAYISLSSGTGYLSAIAYLSMIALLLMELRIANTRPRTVERAIAIAFFVLMCALYSLSYLIYSSRSPVVEMVLILAFGYNYIYKKISIKDIFKPYVIAIVLAIFAIIVVMPSFRTSNGISSRDVSFTESLSNNFNAVFDEFSYVGRDAFVYDHFNMGNMWYGKSYINLLAAPIPSSLLSNKPPVDDGLYLCNIMNGFEVSPPTGRNSLMIKYSIPFSTPGIAYANFGVLGVFLAQMIMGMLYGWMYKRIVETESVIVAFQYELIIYQLELGVLSIVQTLTPLVVIFIVFKTITGYKIKSKWRTDEISLS